MCVRGFVWFDWCALFIDAKLFMSTVFNHSISLPLPLPPSLSLSLSLSLAPHSLV